MGLREVIKSWIDCAIMYQWKGLADGGAYLYWTRLGVDELIEQILDDDDASEQIPEHWPELTTHAQRTDVMEHARALGYFCFWSCIESSVNDNFWRVHDRNRPVILLVDKETKRLRRVRNE